MTATELAQLYDRCLSAELRALALELASAVEKPKTHLLDAEGPAFTYCGLPDSREAPWPPGHWWATQTRNATCQTCLEKALERMRRGPQ